MPFLLPVMPNLIVYFSRKGDNYFEDGIHDTVKGNTEIVAEHIQRAVGGDLFEVVPVKPYPTGYHECTEVAKKELNANARPEIKGFVDDISKYDTIFVGYPNWWSNMPMCLCTFLEHYDFTGKTIAPFCTNEGSGMGSSERQLKSICKGAKVVSGLPIQGSRAKEAEPRVASWAKGIVKAI